MVQNAGHVGAQVEHRLPGHTKDQVCVCRSQAARREQLSQLRERLARRRRVMQPIERAQAVVLKCLNSHGYARDPGCRIRRQIARLQRAGIGFQGDFRIGGKARYYADLLTKEDAEEAWKFAKEKSLPLIALGAGSNTVAVMVAPPGASTTKRLSSTTSAMKPGTFQRPARLLAVVADWNGHQAQGHGRSVGRFAARRSVKLCLAQYAAAS